MVKHVVFAVPGSLDTPTGGYAYDRRIIAELRELGWFVECLDIGEGFPSPDEATRSTARSLLLKVPTGQPIVLDGLALGVLPDVAAKLASRQPATRIGASSPRPGMGTICQSGRRAASQRAGRPCCSARSRCDKPCHRKACRCRLWRTNGTHHGGKARQRSCAAVHAEAKAKFRICCPLASIVPRKGFDVLIAALGETC